MRPLWRNMRAKAAFLARRSPAVSRLLCCRRKDELWKLWLRNDQRYVREAFSSRRAQQARRNVLLRWSLTRWCNYRCPYCPQSHHREKETHAFDNYSVTQWLEAFDRHFRDTRHNLVLTITGGEPMLDAVHMPVLLSELCRREYLLCLRLDTNLSWPLESCAGIDKQKLWLMCTFHPTQIAEDEFFLKILAAQRGGFNIGMCNYVMTGESGDRYRSCMQKLLAHGIPLHPTPLFDGKHRYQACHLQILQEHLPTKDFLYRSGKRSTFIRPCLFPALGYELAANGLVKVGCHSGNSLRGNFVTDACLPKLFDSYVPCPQRHCKCLDKYSFLMEFNRNFDLNPLYSYRHQLLALYAGLRKNSGSSLIRG